MLDPMAERLLTRQKPHPVVTTHQDGLRDFAIENANSATLLPGVDQTLVET